MQKSKNFLKPEHNSIKKRSSQSRKKSKTLKTILDKIEYLQQGDNYE